jgi:S-formylglutathione hydrolase
MSELELTAMNKCFGGEQRVYKHASKTLGCDMAFSVFVPAEALGGEKVPCLWYLSGLTCTEQNVTTKSGFQRTAAEHGLVVVCPDTSPRGLGYEGEDDDWDFGTGAGFYVDATEAPWSGEGGEGGYKMYSYVTEELRLLCLAQLPIDGDRMGITGHSMGGHGALVIGLRLPEVYKSISAFAPITHPSEVPWGHKALGNYLGDDRATWADYDAVRLIEAGRRSGDILVDQGTADGFLEEQLRPDDLDKACQAAGQPLTLRRQAGYDHSYYFIASFMGDHIAFHAARLKGD